MEIDNAYNFTGLVQRGDKAINERYRPRTFHEVIGNTETKRSLAGWMERGSKRSASILLTGGSGQGKTTIARILAMGLNCEKGCDGWRGHAHQGIQHVCPFHEG